MRVEAAEATVQADIDHILGLIKAQGPLADTDAKLKEQMALALAAAFKRARSRPRFSYGLFGSLALILAMEAALLLGSGVASWDAISATTEEVALALSVAIVVLGLLPFTLVRGAAYHEPGMFLEQLGHDAAAKAYFGSPKAPTGRSLWTKLLFATIVFPSLPIWIVILHAEIRAYVMCASVLVLVVYIRFTCCGPVPWYCCGAVLCTC